MTGRCLRSPPPIYSHHILFDIRVKIWYTSLYETDYYR